MCIAFFKTSIDFFQFLMLLLGLKSSFYILEVLYQIPKAFYVSVVFFMFQNLLSSLRRSLMLLLGLKSSFYILKSLELFSCLYSLFCIWRDFFRSYKSFLNSKSFCISLMYFLCFQIFYQVSEFFFRYLKLYFCLSNFF